MPRNNRQRRENNPPASAAPFTQVAQDDPALREDNDDATPKYTGMSFFGRFLVFLALPFMIGSLGLVFGYVQSRKDGDRKLDFDIDFVFPFLVALSIGVVVAIQTKGFTKPPTPFVKWPKVHRKKKIRRKRVIVDDDNKDAPGEETEQEEDKGVPDKKND